MEAVYWHRVGRSNVKARERPGLTTTPDTPARTHVTGQQTMPDRTDQAECDGWQRPAHRVGGRASGVSSS